MADAVETKSEARIPAMHGRMAVYADVDSVEDAGSAVEVLNDCLPAFLVNKSQILYLWDYYRGKQPILDRVKDVRPEICNKVVENHAQEIVAFKVGYQLAEPLQYTLRNHEGTSGPEGGAGETKDGYERHLGDLNELNSIMEQCGKACSDRDLFEHMCVCGVGYRMIESSDGESPFEVHVLDPWSTFVVRSSSYHHRPVMAVWVACEGDGSKDLVYNVFTDDMYYLVKGNDVVESKPHTYGGIPIVEYPLNRVRMGVFEPVLPLLDALNLVESNRLDGIEQTVQSLMKFINCDVDKETFEAMLELGAVKVKSQEGANGDVDFIKNDLDQTQTQVAKDDIYQSIVNICGMPNRQTGGGSTSDTGAAVMLRDGWTMAESHAKSYELNFKKAEREFLRIALKVCSDTEGVSVDLRLRDIELTFSRRNYENIQVKAQVLTTMLASAWIHPEIAFKSCGMFTDPEAAYLLSKRWHDESAQEGRDDDPDPEPQGPDGGQSFAATPEPDGGSAARSAASAA